MAALWGCSVRELLSRIDSRELAEWQAYQTLDPFGNERGDLQAGIIASAAVAPHVRKGRKRPKPADFMPKWGPRKPQNIMAKLKALTIQMGGTITEKK